MILTRLYKEFFESEKSAGLVLIACTILSISLANSFFGNHYVQFWQTNFAGHTLVQWIDDGLMAIFFLLIGLELEREIYLGEFSNFKDALLPIFAAVGGMLIPVSLYFILNIHSESMEGAGVPMATDIAFALGILSLLGNRVPLSLKIFLTALAVIDDLGAVLVIAFFYSGQLAWTNLFIALGIFGFLIILNRMKVHNLIPYIIGGIIMWYFMLNSGIHATITGILLALAIPFTDGKKHSPSYLLQHFLHKPVAFLILPIFALANTAIVIGSNWVDSLWQVNNLGIMVGLLIGKPLGIVLFSFIAVSLGICSLPSDLRWREIIGVGFLGGIGFTMSIFITFLAFDNPALIDSAKIAVIIASLIAGSIGMIWLRFVLRTPVVDEEAED
jgi:NhaA family Na+:H+ antiporter